MHPSAMNSPTSSKSSEVLGPRTGECRWRREKSFRCNTLGFYSVAIERAQLPYILSLLTGTAQGTWIQFWPIPHFHQDSVLCLPLPRLQNLRNPSRNLYVSTTLCCTHYTTERRWRFLAWEKTTNIWNRANTQEVTVILPTWTQTQRSCLAFRIFCAERQRKRGARLWHCCCYCCLHTLALAVAHCCSDFSHNTTRLFQILRQ